MKNTIIWDMDGTILNTLDDLRDSVNYTMEKFGFGTFNHQEIKAMLGNGLKLLIEQALPEGRNNPKFDDCLRVFKEYYNLHMNDKTRPYPQIAEVMEILRKKGYKQAIVSNKIDMAVQKLAEDYYPFVDVALGEREGIKRKPAPDMVDLALTELNAAKNEAVYIGDSEVDLATAKNSGLDCISVLWGFRDRQDLLNAGVKYLAENPMQILDILQQMS